MRRVYSAAIGLVGGIVDMIAGFALLQSAGMAEEPMMVPSLATWGGYFLVALGGIVLLTALYLLTSRMMRNSSVIGSLMVLYGGIMLILGVAMLGQVFSMMQGSTLSGVVMLVIGVAMLYSGYGMSRK
jgi:hypothetical protein